MPRPCFKAYFVDEPSDGDDPDEADWDEATRLFLRPKAAKAPRPPAQALCDCGRPLRRLAKVPHFAACLAFANAKQCQRCEEEVILPGEIHFTCGSCEDVWICKGCGPGVYIERRYEFVNVESNERLVEDMPKEVLHFRSARRRLNRSAGRRTRSVSLSPGTLEVARRVVEVSERIGNEIAAEEGMYDHEWQTDGVLFLRLLGAASLQEAMARFVALAKDTCAVVARQPIISEVAAPCKVFGDIHGQLRDLLLLFHAFGMPGSDACPAAIFNGDFVDRGRHQIEVLCVLFALKVCFPSRVWLNRGNHEDPMMNIKYGFKATCEGFSHPWGARIFEAVETTFAHLPMAALVGGKVLVLHGGIGDGKWTLQDVRCVRRPLSHEDLQEPGQQFLWNILWSDPIEDDQAGTSVFGVHNSPRSRLAVKFGWNVTQAFCARNGLDLIIRSHQSKRGGLGFDVMHNESLIRVFSARDYERNGNDGAILHITSDEDGKLIVKSQVLASLTRDDDEDSDDDDDDDTTDDTE